MNSARPMRSVGSVVRIGCLLGLMPVLAWAKALPLPLPPEPPPGYNRPATPIIRPSGQSAPEKPPGAPKESAPPAPAATQEANKGSVTGLPIPRFVALRTDDVNMRKGPGFRYPIEWVYKRRDLPVEILREFEVWRLVETPDGARGWIHEATLVGRRTFIVQGSDATLRSEPREDASAVAILKAGVVGRIRSCDAASAWCRVVAGDHGGYLKRTQFWGALPDEVVHP